MCELVAVTGKRFVIFVKNKHLMIETIVAAMWEMEKLYLLSIARTTTSEYSKTRLLISKDNNQRRTKPMRIEAMMLRTNESERSGDGCF